MFRLCAVSSIRSLCRVDEPPNRKGAALKSIRLGIIGVGFGQQVLAPAFGSDPRVTIAAICASRQDRARIVADRLGIAGAMGDWRRMVATPEIDAIAIAVPPTQQAEIVVAAAVAGKHVFCEKPMALNVHGAGRMLEAAQTAGVVHAIDLLFPELEAFRKAKETLVCGVLGPIRSAALTWRVETRANRTQGASWKTQSTQGGGALCNFASHTFHYLEWLLGPIERLGARLSGMPSAADARVDAWLEMAAGYPATVSIATDAFLGSGHVLEVYGEHGTLVLQNRTSDHARGFSLWLGTREAGTLSQVACEAPPTEGDGRIAPVRRIAGRFVDAIAGAKPMSPDLHDGLRVQVLIDAARRSHETGFAENVAHCSPLSTEKAA